MDYINYRYCADYIITGNSEMTVEFFILLDLFETETYKKGMGGV